MNKAELIRAMANFDGRSQAQHRVGLDTFLAVVEQALSKKENISITGFGVFSVKHRNGHTAKNPRTGEEVEIPSRNVPHFKPGKVLKDKVQ